MFKKISRPNQWFNIKGRATLTEFVLVKMLVVGLIFLALFPSFSNSVLASLRTPLLILAFVMSACALIRRLHDQDKSGFIGLLTLVPIVGWIYWLILVTSHGTVGPNSYGDDPRGREEPIGTRY